MPGGGTARGARIRRVDDEVLAGLCEAEQGSCRVGESLDVGRRQGPDEGRGPGRRVESHELVVRGADDGPVESAVRQRDDVSG